ncbi:MAG TPA: hypothetical protein VJV03_02795, partial [Pyrinomonadaceae bacterium]|nr:hypothetical protein [Pyrinomonadaceae bacterium]
MRLVHSTVSIRPTVNDAHPLKARDRGRRYGLPSDVRKVSDLPHNLPGNQGYALYRSRNQGKAPKAGRKLTEGQRPSAHQTAKPLVRPICRGGRHVILF